MIIGVDVDGVVVDTPTIWLDYLRSITGVKIDTENVVDYDYTRYFKDELGEMGTDGMDFWRRRDLYDNLLPVDGAQQELQFLKEMGHEIVFVSSIKGDHSKSKYYFLKKHFPFMDGYLTTKEKRYAGVDILVDDFANNFIGSKFHCLLFPARYNDLHQGIPSTMYRGIYHSHHASAAVGLSEWNRIEVDFSRKWHLVKWYILNYSEKIKH